MIIQESRLNVADNSGAKEVLCIRVLSSKKSASIGDKIKITIKSVKQKSPLKKGEMSEALVVRTKKQKRRKDGTWIRFGENACVLLDAKGELRGTRVFGPMPKEELMHNEKYKKLLSWSPLAI